MAFFGDPADPHRRIEPIVAPVGFVRRCPFRAADPRGPFDAVPICPEHGARFMEHDERRAADGRGIALLWYCDWTSDEGDA